MNEDVTIAAMNQEKRQLVRIGYGLMIASSIGAGYLIYQLMEWLR